MARNRTRDGTLLTDLAKGPVNAKPDDSGAGTWEVARMEIPFRVKDSETSGVLTHLETRKGDGNTFLIRAAYRSDVLVTVDQILVFVEHDGTPLELLVGAASTDGHVYLGPDNASDFAVAFGLE